MSTGRTPPVLVAITGASGAPYAVRLVEQLALATRPVSLIVSSHGWRLLGMEAGIADVAALRSRVGAARWDAAVTVYDDGDRGAAPASGSARSSGMVVCPCSMGTLAAIAHGTSRSLIERAADVTLKERRPLLLVPRETPLSIVHLENMLRVSRAGAIVLPAAPGFYHGPTRIDDLVDFIVARVLDHLGVDHRLSGRWGDAAPRRGADA
ncbi:MAG TPA: flavin prenyltransferase UbiX [Gemmatimonadaceae bacterium]|nr:flavin prenyltransferase UbiX [Gemmatimonadaceae bacterium]